MSDKVFLDTNIFLYAFSTKDDRKHSISEKLLLERATISIQIVNEASNNLIKKLHFSEDQVQNFIRSCYKRYEYSYYDSLVISAALLSNCSILYSEDMQHHQRIENKLTIVNPFE